MDLPEQEALKEWQMGSKSISQDSHLSANSADLFKNELDLFPLKISLLS